MFDRIVVMPCVFVALTAILLLLPACDSMDKMGAPLGNPLPSLAGNWSVEQIAGVDVASMMPAGMRLPSLSIGADGSVAGFGGVNNFNGNLDPEALLGGDFSLGPVASTKMAGPPEAMQVESKLFDALAQATGFRLDGNALSLTKADQTLLHARRTGG